jgi:hypothetical protein
MPVVLRVKGYRFWFYEADVNEPPHIHVGKAGMEAKYWLNPISSANVRGFRPHELNEIERIVVDHRDDLLEAWAREVKKHDNG